MRVLIQRVKKVSLFIKDTLYSEIDQGLLVFLGIEIQDTEEDIDYLCGKISQIRIFDDENGQMNLNVQQIDASIMLISQFTLMASTKKGNRPSYIRAAKPEFAIPLYEKFCDKLKIKLQKEIKTGVFGEEMQVELINDGPVTIMIDSKNKE